jgi:hypothetical protein
MKKGVDDGEICQEMISLQDMLLFCLIACKFIYLLIQIFKKINFFV